jgi:hypothetical protein
MKLAEIKNRVVNFVKEPSNQAAAISFVTTVALIVAIRVTSDIATAAIEKALTGTPQPETEDTAEAIDATVVETIE